MYRNSYLEIDLNKVKANAEYFIRKNHKKLIGVIKANGYGIIDYMEAQALKEAGVDFFAVSSLDEAMHLRKHGISGHILILGQVPTECMDLIRENDLSIVTVSREFLEACDLKDVKVHLKLDTGMNRIGVDPEEAKQILDLLKDKGAIIEGIMSHFSSADEDAPYSEEQYQLFRQTVLSLNYDFPYIHMSATDAALIIDDDICNAQRIGLGLLGFSSYETDLQPCVKVFSEVTMCKKLSAGETVSYGRHYRSDGNGYLLTVPIGYADGFYRTNTGRQVYCENEYGTIVGSVCMDQMMILTQQEHPVSAKVEIFGDHIDIAQRANELGTITYELFTSLSDRLERRFYKNGELICRIVPRF
ncbi:MAG: alanine racemase [Erysipelotrichaceae bacterium]|nr:alanine racemase [Erysipelotrichaceae bacterium]